MIVMDPDAVVADADDAAVETAVVLRAPTAAFQILTAPAVDASPI